MKNISRLILFALFMLLMAGLFSCKKNKTANKTTSSTYDFTCDYYWLNYNQQTWSIDTILQNSVSIINCQQTAQQYEDSNQSTNIGMWFMDCN